MIPGGQPRASMSAGDFMASAPKALNGNTPWSERYAVEIKRVWHAEAAQAPRSLQQHLGPSELGVECDRQVAGKIAALPYTNHVVDPWPSTRGRALHEHAEQVFGLDNLRTGLARWATERKVTPHPEHPGTADLYDAAEAAVVDHKFLGESSMDKLRRTPPRKYRRQLLLYGLGYYLEGFPVRRVVIVGYPATKGSLDGLYVWEQAFSDDQGQILLEVMQEIAETFDDTERRKAQAAELIAGHQQLLDVPASTNSDECYFCPFYRPQVATAGGHGCPGASAT